MPAIRAVTFPMAPRSRFERHLHDTHQLVWAANGVLTVVADTGTWVLPPSRALWIPAGLPHETIASERSTMRTLYLDVESCPIRWQSPRPVLATALLAALVEHLSQGSDLEPQHRARAEELIFDLLEPVEVATIQVTMPSDERALEVAHALVSDPADTRNLTDWGREVGASGRTLTPRVPRRHRYPVRPVAHVGAPPGGHPASRRRRARRDGSGLCRVRDPKRVHRRISSPDRRNPRRLLPGRRALTPGRRE